MVNENKNNVTDSIHRVLARKYRPLNFTKLVGQNNLIKTLSGSIERGRLAHAYILTGVRGVGKTSTARIIAKLFNCTNPEKSSEIAINPCGVCDSCLGIAEGKNIDVLEIDAASNTGVDNIRELIDGVGYKPLTSKFRVYIIDEVHMLSKGAFNALLKTLEEPPEHVKFIFATTEIRKVPITILSRCQRFDLQIVPSKILIDHLKWVCEEEKINFTLEALQIIVRVSGGSVRDALSLLDQSASISGDDIKSETISFMLGLPSRVSSIEILENIFDSNIENALKIYDNVINHGTNGEILIGDMLDIIHLSTRINIIGEKNLDTFMNSIPDGEKAGILKISKISLPGLTRAWQILLKGIEEIRAAPNPDEAGSMILIRLAYSCNLPDPASLVKKIQASLEENKTTFNDSLEEKDDGKKNTSEIINDQQEINSIDNKTTLAEVNTFEDLVEIFKIKGELLLHAQLLSCVHLISFEKGKLEISISGNTNNNIAKDISKFLKNWTGEDWVISIVDDQGTETLDHKNERKAQEEIENTKNTPEMQKVLKAFPNAELKSVNDKNK
jgi:DNA polymerase-3 subunit gamma/tau|tara:strand:- start:642 stop:2315 length:1674 start_codon:yes stop_codon:yes gene_type:complete